MWKRKVTLLYLVKVNRIYQIHENNFWESESLCYPYAMTIELTHSQLLFIEMNSPISEIQNIKMIRKQNEGNEGKVVFEHASALTARLIIHSGRKNVQMQPMRLYNCSRKQIEEAHENFYLT